MELKYAICYLILICVSTKCSFLYSYYFLMLFIIILIQSFMQFGERFSLHRVAEAKAQRVSCVMILYELMYFISEFPPKKKNKVILLVLYPSGVSMPHFPHSRHIWALLSRCGIIGMNKFFLRQNRFGVQLNVNEKIQLNFNCYVTFG